MTDAELLLNFSHTARLTCPSPFAPTANTIRRASEPQHKESLDRASFSRHVKGNIDVADLSFHAKDGSVELERYTEVVNHAIIVPMGIQAEAPKPSSKENRGSKAAMVNAEDQNVDAQIGLTPSGGLSTGSPRNDKSPPQHGGRIGSFYRQDDKIPKAVTRGIPDESNVGKVAQENRNPDSAINTKTAEENPRSAAFCAACKFERNLSCAEVENSATSWISCDGCKAWFHFACAGFKNEREVRAVDKFRCKKCKPVFGATTYVRKSSRAHSAIDYAGLHQGVIKTSDERMEHHYIQPIKDGIITFLPENFARMRPELVTAEFFAKNGGMHEPVIIPADLNPRPTPVQTAESAREQSHAQPEKAGKAEEAPGEDFEHHYVPNEGQDALDMVIPQGLTVRQVAELYGPEEKVEVIDVKSQNGENKKWNMRRWADYYENPDNKVVRNVISLEVSQSKLGRLIRRPKIVRDLDLQDAVWPEDLSAKGEYPRVQFYCLMSVADCFTDFHIDFGGSSVFYHILKGKKTFLFIPPKEKHLKKYEEWCMSPAQNWTFLADQTKECYRVDLSEGDTMLIPSGWIHAVWTPEDSLVIGGNFLTSMNFAMQLRIAQVEKATGVARKFRYPHFQKLHWFIAFHYMDTDPLPDDLKEDFYRGEVFPREQPIYNDFDAWGENSRPGKHNYNARYYSQGEVEGLRDLTAYLLRTVLIDLGLISEGITTETRNAVRKSIPRSHGDPLDVVKKFAAWCTWKRGNELLHHWAYPDAKLEENIPPEKLSVATMKKLDREAAKSAALQAPRRQSARKQSVQGATLPLDNTAPQEFFVPPDHQNSEDSLNASSAIVEGFLYETNKKGRVFSSVGSGPNRKTACEACRKRRRACKHKDQMVPSNQSDELKHFFHVSAQDKTVFTQPISNDGAEDTPSQSIDGIIVAVPPRANSIHEHNGNTMYQTPQRLQDGSEDVYKNAKEERAEILASGLSNTGLSRPRTKACNDCRKSKVILPNSTALLMLIVSQRRCIHDAFGNEDPMKVAEQIIPRPHARKSHKTKNANVLSIFPQEQPGSTDPFTDTAVATLDRVAALQPTPVGQDALQPGSPDTSSSASTIHSRIGIEAVQTPAEGTNIVETPSDQSVAESGVVINVQHSSMAERPDEGVVLSEATPSQSRPATALARPSSSLISPPASSNDDIGSSPINTAMMYSPSPPPSKLLSNQAHKEVLQRHTPESGSLRRASSSSFEQRRQDHGHYDAKKLPIAAPSSETRTAPMAIADEESLRLIKELQVQEYGLRRRGKA